MKLNTIRKIVLEDYPDTIRSWFTKLTQTLNPFLEQVYSTLVNGVTIRDNLKAQVFTQTLSSGTSELSLQYNLNERPTMVLLGQILKSDGSHPTNQITMTWQFINGTLKLKFSNLASTKYNVTVVAIV